MVVAEHRRRADLAPRGAPLRHPAGRRSLRPASAGTSTLSRRGSGRGSGRPRRRRRSPAWGWTPGGWTSSSSTAPCSGWRRPSPTATCAPRGRWSGSSRACRPPRSTGAPGSSSSPSTPSTSWRSPPRASPAWLERARRLLMLPDYFHLRLCGVASNEYTNVTTSQLSDVQADDWDDGLLEAGRGLAGAPLAAGGARDRAGRGRPGRRRRARRVKVIAPATHDTASAVAAIPLEGPDEAFLSSGHLVADGRREPGAARRRGGLPPQLHQRGRAWGGASGCSRTSSGSGWSSGSGEELGGEDHAGAGRRRRAPAAPWRSLIDPEDPRFLQPALDGRGHPGVLRRDRPAGARRRRRAGPLRLREPGPHLPAGGGRAGRPARPAAAADPHRRRRRPEPAPRPALRRRLPAAGAAPGRSRPRPWATPASS